MGSLLTSAAAHEPSPRVVPATGFTGMVPLASLPLTYFVPNQGQARPEVRFIGHTRGGVVFLTNSELVFGAPGGTPTTLPKPAEIWAVGRAARPSAPPSALPLHQSSSGELVRLQFIGGNPSSRAEGLHALPGVVNVFRGSDPGRWRSGIPTFRAVRYRDIYPGIDVVFHCSVDGLEYDFEVAPGADASRIRLAMSGSGAIRSDPLGDLYFDGPQTGIVHRRPHAFQRIAGREQGVAVSFRQLGSREFGFKLGHYDTGALLTIDPTFVFSTYFGGTGLDSADGVAVDKAGNIYVVGTTTSTDLPTLSAFQPKKGTTDSDVFVAKLDASGSRLLYCTYLGGSSGDGTSGFCGPQIVVTEAGSAVLTGSTASTDFPTTPGAFQATSPGGFTNAFVTKIDPTGAHLLYSTYLGGPGTSTVSYALAVTADGSAVVVGSAGLGFPEVNPIAEARGAHASAFLTKLSPDGGSVVFSTRFGGSGSDRALSVAADASGKVWVAGSTASADFPTKNALQPNLRGIYEACALGDAFVAKFDTTTPALEYSTFLGGRGWDYATSVAVDPEGAAYVGGITSSPDFPIVGGFQGQLAPPEGCAGFLAKISPSGSSLVFSSYVGGGNGCFSPVGGCPLQNDGVAGLAVDPSGHVWMTGVTTSPVFPLSHPLQASLQGFSDAFISKVARDGSSLLFSTYLGGTGADLGGAITIGVDGTVIVAGTTFSTDFPVVAAQFPYFAGGLRDAFIAKLSVESAALGATASATPAAGVAPLAVSFSGGASGGNGIYAFDWDFGDGSPHSAEQNPSHIYAVGGSYIATVRVADSAAATGSASVAISVTPNCWVACTASVPLATSVGQVTSFTGSAIPADCSGSVSYSWGFGDGQASTQQGAVHSYSSPGLYLWSFAATAGQASCTRSGTIVVTNAAANFSYLIPALAHKSGYYESQWRADLTVLNPNDAPANLTLAYFSESAPVVRTAVLAGHTSVAWKDVLVSLFGFPQDVSTSGVVQVISDVRVASTGRSYNLSAGGTFGGAFPALTATDGLGSGKIGLLLQLKRNASYRSNVGFVTLATFPCMIRLRLFSAGGAKLGEKTLEVAAGRWTQLDDVFGTLGAGDADLAYGTVEVLTEGGTVWAYAAVIDNATSDPTIVPVIVP